MQNLANDLRNMCRKHNPTRRHRRIVHGQGAVEKEEGLHSLVVPQVWGVLPDPLHLQKKNRVLLDSATELAERTRSICRGSHVVTLQTVSTIEVLTASAERTAGGH